MVLCSLLIDLRIYIDVLVCIALWLIGLLGLVVFLLDCFVLLVDCFIRLFC